MIRILGAVTLLILVATLALQAAPRCRDCGEEIRAPSLAWKKGEEIPTPSFFRKGEEIPTPSFFPWVYFSGRDATSGTNVVSRRRAYFYSWRSECYAQDRAGKWHWVDPRLC